MGRLDINNNSLEFLKEIIFHPNVFEGHFWQEYILYVEKEKPSWLLWFDGRWLSKKRIA